MIDLEKEFINSLKALLVRYGVNIEKGFSCSDNGEVETEWKFSNDVDLRENEIYLTMDDIHSELVRLESK